MTQLLRYGNHQITQKTFDIIKNYEEIKTEEEICNKLKQFMQRVELKPNDNAYFTCYFSKYEDTMVHVRISPNWEDEDNAPSVEENYRSPLEFAADFGVASNTYTEHLNDECEDLIVRLPIATISSIKKIHDVYHDVVKKFSVWDTLVQCSQEIEFRRKEGSDSE